ncbi:MAG: hypothetical protein FWG91_01450 [Lachnospiraceae bacterium]|nr:hypothetical protein [Lachnospiraceae bacterium]
MLNTAIITYADNNCEENLEKDFLYSLRNKANYCGKIIILDYGISLKAIKKIKELYNVKVVQCKKDMPVFTQRYRDLPIAIEALDEAITHILLIDGGDIWFQGSIDGLFRDTIDKIGCVEEESIFDKDAWTAKSLSYLSKKEQSKIYRLTKDEHVKNSGMVCGPREYVSQLIKRIYAGILISGINYFGIDQLFFNYEFMKIKKEKRIILDNDYNFVIVTNQNDYYIENSIIYRKNDNKRITVVHNAGGAWRVLERPFANRNIDKDQYIIENVKIIR